MNKRDETLQRYVSDMLAVERHILEPLERQASDERFQGPAKMLVADIEMTMRRHIDSLEAHLKMLGGDEGAGLKKAATALLGVAAGIIDKVRPDTVSTALRDDYTALNLAAISYSMLHTTGLALSSRPTADLAATHLRNLAGPSWSRSSGTRPRASTKP